MMANKNVVMTDSAVLVWLSKGESPSGATFELKSLKTPPMPNPEPWWKAGDAINFASRLTDNHGKLPWLKVGGQVLSPDEIVQMSGRKPGWNS
jgi:hypothetical protein